MAATHTISIPGANDQDAQKRAEALLKMAGTLKTENLVLLADRSQKKGINDKIQKYKKFL